MESNSVGTFWIVKIVDMFPRTNGNWLKDWRNLKYADINSDQSSHVETVALLSHQKLTEYVQIPYEPEDKTAHAFRDATYKEIKDWIKKVFDMKVSSLYIAQMKDECGLEKRQNYNKSKKENAKVPTCPKEKRKAILAALRHFQMIDNE